MNICGCLVHVSTAQAADARGRLEAMHGVEVHAGDAAARNTRLADRHMQQAGRFGQIVHILGASGYVLQRAVVCNGLPDLKMAKLSDMGLLELARREAIRLFEKDPALSHPEHRLLHREVGRLWQDGGSGVEA